MLSFKAFRFRVLDCGFRIENHGARIRRIRLEARLIEFGSENTEGGFKIDRMH